MVSRSCVQCARVFSPRREHARFCSPGCRVGWNHDHLNDAVAEERALGWSLAGMGDVIGRLNDHQPSSPAGALDAVAEAVWWVTIIDARLIRQYMDVYDAVLAAHDLTQRPAIEGMLAGLRFVRNQLGEARPRTGFIEPPDGPGAGEAMAADWRWSPLPSPELSDQPAHGQPWEATRYLAYQQWLAGNRIGTVFARAATFVNQAADRATATPLTSHR
jgi:hypothetical protein